MREIKTLEDFGGLRGEDCSQAFLRAAAFFSEAGGGTLVIDEGEWKTGPVRLVSDMTLELKEGAFLSFIPEPERYIPVESRWEGVRCHAMHPCIFASGETNVHLVGSGAIDGSGAFWWELAETKKKQGSPVSPLEKALAELNPGYESQPGGGGGRQSQFLRPPLVQFFNCTDCSVEGIELRNSPFWTLHPVFCERLRIDSVRITNPPDAPNTDGIDIDSCTDVEIRNCTVSVGDDGIALKSGSGADGIEAARPCEGVRISGCRVEAAHGGVVIGSETAAGIRDVCVEDCVFDRTDRGIRIKTRRGRGGDVGNLVFRRITVLHNLCPIAVNMYYRCGTAGTEEELFSLSPQPVRPDTPRIHDIHISALKAEGCRASAGFVAGLPEAPVRGLIIEDCECKTDEADPSSPSLSDMYAGLPDVAGKSFRVLNAEDPRFERVRIIGPEPPFVFE